MNGHDPQGQGYIRSLTRQQAPEIFPTTLRAKGNGFLTAGWGLGIGSGVLWFPLVMSKLGYQTFYIFGALNYLWVVVVYCFFPETAGRSPGSIDLLFRSNSWFVWQNEKDYIRLGAEHDASVRAVMEQMEKAGGSDERIEVWTDESHTPEQGKH